MTGFESFFGGGSEQADAQRWLDDCEQAADVAPHNGGPKPAFNDWERGFLKSVREDVNEGRELTRKQRSVLKQLWDRV